VSIEVALEDTRVIGTENVDPIDQVEGSDAATVGILE